MKTRLRKGAAAFAASAAAAGLALAATPLVASAATKQAPQTISDAVFVQSNDVNGNQILAYSRATNGTLAFEHAYSTGGRGARASGAVVDPLASQGSLRYDRAGDLLIAVNAGSNTITTFHVNGWALSHAQVFHAGSFPVSVAAHGHLVYVLDAGGAGAVRGYLEDHGNLTRLAGSARSLNLNPSLAPQFLNTPGQIGFTPDGAQLVVTTKANGSDIDVFAVRSSGRLSTAPGTNASATAVPFGFVFDPHGRLVVAEAGSSDVSTYGVDADGSITNASSVTDGQKAACWIASVGGYYYVANAGSADIAAYQVSDSGVASLITANRGIAGTTDAGPIDLAGSADGQYLYVEAGGTGAVDEFAVNSDGTLSSVGTITGLSATGIEGIVAS